MYCAVDPPSAVPCPIAGRYKFEQRALSKLEEYRTRIRGVTEKPRVQVPCRNWVTEMKSCSNTMTRIEIDAEYCESVDYRGRPIGEYGGWRFFTSAFCVLDAIFYQGCMTFLEMHFAMIVG